MESALPEGVTAEDINRVRESARKLASRIVHNTFAEYLQSIKQKKLAKAVVAECEEQGIMALAISVSKTYTLRLLLIQADANFDMEILPPPDIEESQVDSMRNTIASGIHHLMEMVLVYFREWLANSPLSGKIRGVCGNISYGINGSNKNCLSLYRDGAAVGEKVMIAVGHYYLDGDKPLFPTRRTANQANTSNAAPPSNVNQ